MAWTWHFNQHVNDVLGEALSDCFCLELLHHHVKSFLHLCPANIDNFFHVVFQKARLVEKLGSAQLLSTLGSSSVQSTWGVVRVPPSPS